MVGRPLILFYLTVSVWWRPAVRLYQQDSIVSSHHSMSPDPSPLLAPSYHSFSSLSSTPSRKDCHGRIFEKKPFHFLQLRAPLPYFRPAPPSPPHVPLSAALPLLSGPIPLSGRPRRAPLHLPLSSPPCSPEPSPLFSPALPSPPSRSYQKAS